MWGIIQGVKMTLAQTATFVSLWRHCGLNDEDLRSLECQVMDNPLAGRVMRNTGGVRKVRFAAPSGSSGKSGAWRVCYLHIPRYKIVYFVLVFPKTEQANLTGDQQKMCRMLSRRISDKLSATDSQENHNA